MDNKNKEYVKTTQDIENRLMAVYGYIPTCNLEVYSWLRGQAGLNGECKLSYEERVERHNNILSVLKLGKEGGLAGRDINEY